MSLLTKVSRSCGVRFLSSIGSAAQTKQHLQTEKLNKRSLVRIAGKDAVPFLQGLVTNDVEHLWHGSPAIYSMFLNKGGRVLYDSIIYRSPHENTYFIECDESVDRELAQHLKLFRVRRKISVDTVSTEFVVWVVHDRAEILNSVGEKIAPTTLEPVNNKEVIVSHDPRLKQLGTRLVVPHDYNIHDINKYFPENELQPVEPENDYTTLRYKLGIGEGIVDHPPTKSFPMETNCDYLHGISFHKGCYLGQELTARTYHTGVIRKRLMPLQVPDKEIPINENTNVQTLSGANVGKLRGHKSSYGLALMRVEQALDAPSLVLNGDVCTVKKPFWWPGALPTREEIAAEKQKSNGRAVSEARTIPTI